MRKESRELGQKLEKLEVKKEREENRKVIAELRKDNEKLKAELDLLNKSGGIASRKTVDALEERMEMYERYVRRSNIIIRGYTFQDGQLGK